MVFFFDSGCSMTHVNDLSSFFLALLCQIGGPVSVFSFRVSLLFRRRLICMHKLGLLSRLYRSQRPPKYTSSASFPVAPPSSPLPCPLTSSDRSSLPPICPVPISLLSSHPSPSLFVISLSPTRYHLLPCRHRRFRRSALCKRAELCPFTLIFSPSHPLPISTT